MISWIYILLSTATAVILVTGYQLVQQEKVRATTTRPTPVPVQLYDSPGPVIASRVDQLQLDGLTIIPV